QDDDADEGAFGAHGLSFVSHGDAPTRAAGAVTVSRGKTAMWKLAGREFRIYVRTLPVSAEPADLTNVVARAIRDKGPPRSQRGSRLAILVHQGSDPTQPYPTSVIRDRAPRFFHGFAPWGQIRRCSALRPDGHSVRSASPDSLDFTGSPSSFAKTTGRILPRRCGPAPRRFRTRASCSVSGAASSRCRVAGR